MTDLQSDQPTTLREPLRRALELLGRGDADGAEAAVLRPVVDAEQASGAGSAAFIEAVSDLGRYLLLAGEPQRAVEAFRRGVEAPIGKDPRTVRARFAAMADLGDALRATGEWEEAEDVLREGLERREARFGRRAAEFAEGLLPLAELLLAEGRYEEALPLAEEAGLNLAANRDPRFLLGIALRAEILARLDREPLFPPLEELPEEAVAALAETVWARLTDGGAPDVDIRLLEALLPSLEDRLGQDSDPVLFTLSHIAEAERQRGAADADHERRLQALQRLAESFARRGEPAQVLAALQGLALAYSDAGRPDAALSTYQEAVYRAEELGDPALKANALRNYGLQLAEAGKDADAEARLRDALAAVPPAAADPAQAEARAHAAVALGVFLTGRGRPDEARSLLESALAALDPDDPDALTAQRYLKPA